MSSIPEEIYKEILIKLPVKSLLVCKCVCRNWYALISSSDFVKLHHDLITQKNEITLLLKEHCTIFSIIDYHLLTSPICESEDYAAELSHQFKKKLNHPFKFLNSGVTLLGSCNGLVWIWVSGLSLLSLYLFCLWNPATGEYIKLPKPPIEFGYCSFRLHGFGYDQKTDEYKLVVGVQNKDVGYKFPVPVQDPGIQEGTMVQVYSLASNSWKAEKTIPYWSHNFDHDWYEKDSGVLVNGHLHWLVLGQDGLLLLSWDISDESFKEMKLSEELLEGFNKRFIALGVLEGCLCVFVKLYNNNFFQTLTHSEIWEMSDYGAQESWTKRYIISHESINTTLEAPGNSCLMWSFENGKILFMAFSTLFLYDTEHGSARKLNICGGKHSIAKYFESLVPLNSGTYVGKERGIEGMPKSLLFNSWKEFEKSEEEEALNRRKTGGI